MTKQKTEPARRPTDDADAVRREAIALLRGDIGLTDNLKIDLVSTLRLAIDAHHARAMAGERVDLAQLLVAEERLRAILPAARPLPDSKQAEHDAHQAAIAPVIQRRSLEWQETEMIERDDTDFEPWPGRSKTRSRAGGTLGGTNARGSVSQ
jgi:hypothetical protein